MTNPIGTLINGHRYDWSSVEIVVAGKPFIAVQEISYNDTLEPGILRGTKSKMLGRTRGQYEASGSLSMYKEDHKSFIEFLRLLKPLQGWMEVSFLITVVYQEVTSGGGLQTDLLKGCRVTSAEDSHSSGNDPLQVSMDLSIMEIWRNGQPPVLENTGI